MTAQSLTTEAIDNSSAELSDEAIDALADLLVGWAMEDESKQLQSTGEQE